MVTVSLICHLLVAGLLVLGAVKYGRGPVPLDYHQRILEAEGTVLSPYATLIVTALYRGFAGAMLAVAVAVVALSLGPVAAGAPWAEAGLLLIGAAFVAGSAILPYRVEQITGVKTPWRVSLAIGALLVAGVVLGRLA